MNNIIVAPWLLGIKHQRVASKMTLSSSLDYSLVVIKIFKQAIYSTAERKNPQKFIMNGVVFTGYLNAHEWNFFCHQPPKPTKSTITYQNIVVQTLESLKSYTYLPSSTMFLFAHTKRWTPTKRNGILDFVPDNFLFSAFPVGYRTTWHEVKGMLNK